MSPPLIRTCPFSIKAAFSGFIGGTAGAFTASDSICFIGGAFAKAVQYCAGLVIRRLGGT
jgi:hypothetical protein